MKFETMKWIFQRVSTPIIIILFFYFFYSSYQIQDFSYSSIHTFFLNYTNLFLFFIFILFSLENKPSSSNLFFNDSNA